MTQPTPDSVAVRHDHFRSTLGQRRQLIVERWTELRMVRWSRAGIDQLRAWVRELAEHSTEFGYPALGEVARELQHRLDGVIGDYPPFRELIGGITAGVERVNLQIDRVQLLGKTEQQIVHKSERAEHVNPVALLAETDAEAADLMAAVIQPLALDCHTVGDATALRDHLRKDPPALLIIDEDVLTGMGDGLPPLAEGARGRFGETPWILVSRQPDIDLRLRALSAGASACIGKPLDARELAFAVSVACLPHLTSNANVQIVADTPEQAQRHAEALQESGLTPLLGAELASLPDVLAGQAADVLLLDINLDIRQRDTWLNLMAATPGFDCLPVVCLNAQRTLPDTRHRRTQFLPSPVPRKTLAAALRRAILENDRDALRVLELTRLQSQPLLCTRDVFMARLATAVTTHPEGEARDALVVVELDAPLAMLRDHGVAALVAAQDALEGHVLESLAGNGCACRLGNAGMLALVPQREGATWREWLEHLARRLTQPADTPAICTSSAVMLPLHEGVRSAMDARYRSDAALREARKAGGRRFQLLAAAATKAAAAAPPPSPLPVERMSIDIRPLVDATGTPQSLKDASIRVVDAAGAEQPLGVLLAEVVAKGWASQLDIWEMNAAATHLAGLPDTQRGVEIAMRLSTASRESVMLVPVVRSIVAKLPPNRGYRLVFEVAESWLVEHNAAAVEMVEALRGLGCGVMLGDFGGTDNPRNLGWAAWFDYARLSQRRIEHLTGNDQERTAVEKLVRTASSRNARLIAGKTSKKLRTQLADWGIALFEP